jgi:hypothetical protein
MLQSHHADALTKLHEVLYTIASRYAGLIRTKPTVKVEIAEATGIGVVTAS